MILRSVTFTFFAAIFYFLPTTEAAEKELPPLYETVEPGVLTVALYNDFFPFSYIENEKKKGTDYEIAEFIAQKLNLKFKSIFFTADENVDDDLRNFIWKGTSVQRGRVADVMMHAPYDNRIKFQNELVAFFAPYHTDTIALAVPIREDLPYRDMADLKEYKIGVEIDTLADFVLLAHDQGGIAENVIHYRSPYELFSALQKQEVQAVAGIKSQLSAGLNLFNLDKNFEVRDFDRGTSMVRPWDSGIAVRENRRTLGYEITKIIEKMRASGKMKEIYARYGLNYQFE